MAKNTAPQPAAAPDAEAPSPSKAPIIAVVALLSVNLLGTGFIAVKVMKGPPGHAAAEKEAKAKEAKEKLPGPVVSLDTFVVNLNETGSSRYLKTTVELEVADPVAQKEIEEARRAIRDEMLSYLSNLTVKDTMGEAGKNKIKEDLLDRADKAVGGEEKIKHLYLTEFVVQ